MKTAIATGILGLVLTAAVANAQTATEQARILRDFDKSVVEYSRQHKSLDLFPEALTPATPAPKIFTLPVAMVFRQVIAQALAEHSDGTAIGTPAATHRAVALQSFPASELTDFPAALREALPLLPDVLEYRLIDNDLVLRDKDAGVIVAVLREAVGNFTTVRR